jgi:hypothetical protein
VTECTVIVTEFMVIVTEFTLQAQQSVEDLGLVVWALATADVTLRPKKCRLSDSSLAALLEVANLVATRLKLVRMRCELTAMWCELTAMWCELTAMWCELTAMWCEFRYGWRSRLRRSSS